MLFFYEAMGYFNSSITSGAITGTIIAGIMAEIFGLRTMFFILAILPIIGALIVLLKVQETIYRPNRKAIETESSLFYNLIFSIYDFGFDLLLITNIYKSNKGRTLLTTVIE